MKESARARNAEASRSGRDIGELPAVVDPERKEASREAFRRFAETYFPETFVLEWSDDHLKVIARIELVVLHGGLYALAMPRGSGKTSLVEVAAIWAICYGHHVFVALIGATEPAACEMLDSIKMSLETNDLLLDDFPEVCYPIRKLDGIANRCAGQLYQGERTRITWTDKELILPTIEGSPASGAIIRVAGITGRVRGMKFKTPDGRTVRPSLVLPDDPQTDESAKSITQCDARTRVLAGAVQGLAGPGKKISGIMPCTVVRPGDMVDRIERFNEMERELAEQQRYIEGFDASRLDSALMVARRECQALRNSLKDKIPQPRHYAFPARKVIAASVDELAAASAGEQCERLFAMLDAMQADGHDVSGPFEEASFLFYAAKRMANWARKVGAIPAPDSVLQSSRGCHEIRVPYRRLDGRTVTEATM